MTSSPSISTGLERYLRSDTWCRRRQRYLKSVGFRCEECGSGRCLTVHHENYDRLDGNELDADLQCLCLLCHAREHPGKPVRCGPYCVIYNPADPDGTPVTSN